jgi:hypothetical protein
LPKGYDRPTPQKLTFEITDDRNNKRQVSVPSTFLPVSRFYTTVMLSFASGTLEHVDSLPRNDLAVSIGARPIYIPASQFIVVPGQYFGQKTRMVSLVCRMPEQNAKLIQDEGMDLFGVAPANRTLGAVVLLQYSNSESWLI